MSKKKKIIIIAGVVAILAAFIIANLMKGKGGQIEVQVEKIKRGNITQVVSGSGKIKPELEVKISANVSAEIIGLYVKEGNIVHKGDLLVELDRKRYEAAYARAKSSLKSAKASMKKAQSEHHRAEDLFKENLISMAEKESVEASLLLAESNVEQSVASMDQAADDLSKARIYSPIDGTVSRLNKELGEIALGSTFQSDVIMTVADLSKMEVVSEIDENDVVLVSIGDTTKIEVDAIPDTTFRGIVSEIAHSATTRGYGTQDEVTNFEVKIAVIDVVEKLRPGMSCTVDIQTETHQDVLYVPIQSVTVKMPSEIDKDKAETEDDSLKTESADQKEEELEEAVFVIEDEIAKVKFVETGISDDANIEIISGIDEGMDVVTGSYRAISKTLKDGSPIKISERSKNKKAD